MGHRNRHDKHLRVAIHRDVYQIRYRRIRLLCSGDIPCVAIERLVELFVEVFLFLCYQYGWLLPILRDDKEDN